MDPKSAANRTPGSASRALRRSAIMAADITPRDLLRHRSRLGGPADVPRAVAKAPDEPLRPKYYVCGML